MDSHAYPLSRGAGVAEPLQGLFDGTTLGGLCVIAFFAISGFFITKSMAERQAPLQFLAARALRLFPALVVVLLLTVLVLGPALTVAPLAEYWSAVPSYVARNLTLFRLRYDLPGVFGTTPYGPAINGSLWTLSYEVTWYGAVLLAGLLGILRRPAWAAGALVVFGAVSLSQGWLPLSDRILQTLDLGIPFVTGMAFGVWRHHVPLSLPLALCLVVLSACLRSTPLFLPAVAITLSYIVFLAGFARIPAWANFARRSDYSYGMYVYAFPVQQMVALAGIVDPFPMIAISFPLTLALAAASWHLVEAPALQLLRREVRAP